MTIILWTKVLKDLRELIPPLIDMLRERLGLTITIRPVKGHKLSDHDVIDAMDKFDSIAQGLKDWNALAHQTYNKRINLEYSKKEAVAKYYSQQKALFNN